MIYNEFNVEKPIINKENQKILVKFLLNILKDTKCIRIICDCSHNESYRELQKHMEELHIISIKEDWNIEKNNEWKVKAYFKYPLRYLLDFKELENELQVNE